jgi:hypothetical protein
MANFPHVKSPCIETLRCRAIQGAGRSYTSSRGAWPEANTDVYFVRASQPQRAWLGFPEKEYRVTFRSVRIVALLAISGVCATLAHADDQEAIAQLIRLHDRLTQSKTPISVEDGDAALESIRQWNLDPARLGADARARLLGAEAYAALAVGDAARARKLSGALQAIAPDAAPTRRLNELAAVASADAAARAAGITQELRGVHGESRQRLEREQRLLERVGERAPGVTIATDDGAPIAVAQRSQTVLLLDFWSTRTPPSKAMLEGLHGLQSAYREELAFELVGINSDDEPDVGKARALAKANGYTGKIHYEKKSRGAPITHVAFQLEHTPVQVLVDGRGFVAAVGSVGDAGFIYAVRAAVAQARGDFAYLSPTKRSGELAVSAPRASAEEAPAKSPAADSELPSNPEAAGKLTLARTYLKQRVYGKAKQLLQEIVRDYPGTLEAREAQERLDGMP